MSCPMKVNVMKNDDCSSKFVSVPMFLTFMNFESSKISSQPETWNQPKASIQNSPKVYKLGQITQEFSKVTKGYARLVLPPTIPLG